MTKVTKTGTRKNEHIKINLEEDVLSGISSGLEKYRFIHNALPELNLSQIDTRQIIFGKELSSPILISSMTGGTKEGRIINLRLAKAAQKAKIAMGVGSQRAAIESPDSATSFDVRSVAPDILLFANLGAVQLNYDYGIEECKKAVDMISADALILHLNPLQEALQPEGDSNFSGLLKKIELICRNLSVPVIAKEVGWGISSNTARQLIDAGISAIDVAGAGGTSWSQVEKFRGITKQQIKLAASFKNWGIPTAESVRLIADHFPETLLIASGGLSNGIDIAKCLALGAAMGGIAGKFLLAANNSLEDVDELISLIKNEIKLCMFATGSEKIIDLQTKLIEEK